MDPNFLFSRKFHVRRSAKDERRKTAHDATGPETIPVKTNSAATIAPAPNQTVEFTYGLRAKFPLRAKTFVSRVYEYYNPTVEDRAEPVDLVVTDVIMPVMDGVDLYKELKKVPSLSNPIIKPPIT